MKTYQDLVVGFAQIGAESEWRSANTRSIQETAKRLGVELKFADGQQQQDNQIKAIRSFIAQRVDVIGVSPVVETGWDAVFAEVKQAGIPLILLDRHANVPSDLYSAFIGSDFVQEGQRACVEMARLLNNQGNIVELEGTDGSAPALDRRAGFEEDPGRFRLSGAGRIGERGRAVVVRGLQVRPVRQELPDQVRVPGARRQHQDGDAIQPGRGDGGALLQQEPPQVGRGT